MSIIERNLRAGVPMLASVYFLEGKEFHEAKAKRSEDLKTLALLPFSGLIEFK